ncbi:hypothetical protein Hanom_Chr13g01233491 [Helianthus anomalus]
MVTALSPMIDEIWPLDMAKSSSGVEERLLAVQRISEDNFVSGQRVFISSGSFDSKKHLRY